MLGLSLILAYAFDLLVGDPHYAYHPVRLIGRMIQAYEVRLRALIQDESRGGFLLALGIPMDVFFVVILLQWLTDQIHPMLSFFVATFFIYSAISVKDLADHADEVQKALEKEDLPEARAAIGKIVGRDTQDLHPKEVIRATVETVAEGSLDGIISPLFYAMMGGAPFVMVFKAVSTMDSMVGYRDERYERFGKYAARLDDFLNYLPARLTPFLIAAGAFFSGEKPMNAFSIGWRDGRKNPSPNSGFPEAAFAGALGLQLGGLNRYGGMAVEKPLIGDKMKELESSDIRRAVRLMYFSSFSTLIFMLFLWFLFR